MINLKKQDLYENSALNTLVSVKNILKQQKKEPISFIQIGVNDGVNHDIAKDVLEIQDTGIFCEPIEKAFNAMVNNKIKFTKSIFLKKAIVPENLKDNNTMNLLDNDEIGQGSSFGKFNKHRIINTINVDTITVSNLLKEFSIQSLDFFFCDAESIDHLIVTDLLDKIKPEVMFFETCWWCNNPHQLEISGGTSITIPSRSQMKDLLTQNGYVFVDFLEDNNIEKREDILAIKQKYISDLY
jgi:hypothetical protein